MNNWGFTSTTEEIRVQREIIEHNFSWCDLDSRYATIYNTNCFCPFHENHNSPAAKMYEDEDTGLIVLHCFTERRRYTTYDYVKIILVERKKRYKDVWDFLEKNLSEQNLRELVHLAKKKVALEDETALEEKIEYINNLYNEYDDVVEFINRLYSEED